MISKNRIYDITKSILWYQKIKLILWYKKSILWYQKNIIYDNKNNDFIVKRHLIREKWYDQIVYLQYFQTTNPKISPMTRKYCAKTFNPVTLQEEVNCNHTLARWTYGIPLEVIFLTPLSRWNPYDIEHRPGIWATTRDFQQCDILTCVDSNEPV